MATWPGGRHSKTARPGRSSRIYEGGHVEPEDLLPARWDLMPRNRYMWASVQTVRGCPKHCSFCSVWKTDGQRPRQRPSDVVIEEIVELRRRGFRFIALADDNFYPVTLTDLQMASRRADKTQFDTLTAMRADRFELMRRLARLPDDMVFFTQITMEAAEDPEFLDAMRKARIKGALVGIESVTPEGLKDVHKGFNVAGGQSGRASARDSGITASTCWGPSSSACRVIAGRPSTRPSPWRSRRASPSPSS